MAEARLLSSLFEAVLLVVIVVYLFFQSFRATIIRTVAIFVSFIDTFTGMLALLKCPGKELGNCLTSKSKPA